MIDLRSDALVPPSQEMWEAMRTAELGWALVGEDQSVNTLEALAADILGKEAAIFVPTCSMANLLALMTLGTRGTQVILESASHMATTEAGSLAYVCGLLPRIIEGTAGYLDENKIERVISVSRSGHLPRTTMVCLENSHNNAGGLAITSEQTEEAAEAAHRFGASVHLDGARLFNSATALHVPARKLTQHVDTVAISLNKGLCAPFGALLAGEQTVIAGVRENAWRIGASSIHKAGLFAAAGIVALHTMVDRLAEDNLLASQLAERIASVPGVEIVPENIRTNMVFMNTVALGCNADTFLGLLARRGVLAWRTSEHRIRMVTHRGVSARDITEVVPKVIIEAAAECVLTGPEQGCHAARNLGAGVL